MDAELQPHLQNETQVIRQAGREAIRQFLETHNCFAVLRMSGKVVVFDTRIPIQLAFYALVEHGKVLKIIIRCMCMCIILTTTIPQQTCWSLPCGIRTNANSLGS
jgi:hypothetical protein